MTCLRRVRAPLGDLVGARSQEGLSRAATRAIGDGREDKDALLVAAARNGDGDAFDALVERHAARLHGVARRLVPRDLVDDVLQEALWAAWSGLGRFRGEARFTTYLHAIVVRQCRRALRRRRPWAALRHDALTAPTSGPREHAERALLSRAIEDALAALPRRWREVIVMRETAGLRYDEIASALGVPVGTVRSRLSRARVRLRELLEARGVTP